MNKRENRQNFMIIIFSELKWKEINTNVEVALNYVSVTVLVTRRW